MTDVPIFAAEIKIVNDESFGMHFECSEKYAGYISDHLHKENFRCSAPSIEIQGTRNIHSYVKVTVEGKEFQRLRDTIKGFCKSRGADLSEEKLTYPGEETVTLNLHNVSVFDK